MTSQAAWNEGFHASLILQNLSQYYYFSKEMGFPKDPHACTNKQTNKWTHAHMTPKHNLVHVQPFNSILFQVLKLFKYTHKAHINRWLNCSNSHSVSISPEHYRFTFAQPNVHCSDRAGSVHRTSSFRLGSADKLTLAYPCEVLCDYFAKAVFAVASVGPFGVLAISPHRIQTRRRGLSAFINVVTGFPAVATKTPPT